MSLSPAAQAVLDAYHAAPIVGVFPQDADALGVAAALRAAADQVVPVEVSLCRGVRPGGTGSIAPDEFKQDQRQKTRRQLLAIAAELEGGQSTTARQEG
jgi:hypothetical protein